MNSEQKVQMMMDRFVHPNHHYAQQYAKDKQVETPDGTITRRVANYYTVREGGCHHKPRHKKLSECPNTKEAIFTEKQMLRHLQGKETYAPYQIDKYGNVKWLCLDVDSYESVPQDLVQRVTTNVARRIQALVGPNHCLVEDSGSKGYHVWVFFAEPIPALYAHSFGHQIVGSLGVIDSRIHIEVYPKQRVQMSFGNTVKLPLGIHQKTGNRCFFVNSRFIPHEDQWSVLRKVEAIPWEWMKEHVTPLTAQTEVHEDVATDNVPLCLMEILNQGCGEGIRDEAAFRLACYLHDKGFSNKYAVMVLNAWNTLNRPPLDDIMLETKIDSAYSKGYGWSPCMDAGFDKHCQSTCSFFQRKVSRRWFIPDEDPVGVISRE